MLCVWAIELEVIANIDTCIGVIRKTLCIRSEVLTLHDIFTFLRIIYF